MRISSWLFSIAAILSVASCKPEVYTPKPRGYARMDTPQHAYQHLAELGFPYSFDYPVYARISRDTATGINAPDNPFWINMNFPRLGATIFISYKNIDAVHSLDKLLNDAHQMSYFHTKRADYINEPAFHTCNDVHGIMYQVGGNSASAYQFFATDSTRHFLRGALYFDVTPNADSLKPVTEFLKRDMEYILGTLRWQDVAKNIAITGK